MGSQSLGKYTLQYLFTDGGYHVGPEHGPELSVTPGQSLPQRRHPLECALRSSHRRPLLVVTSLPL